MSPFFIFSYVFIFDSVKSYVCFFKIQQIVPRFASLAHQQSTFLSQLDSTVMALNFARSCLSLPRAAYAQKYVTCFYKRARICPIPNIEKAAVTPELRPFKIV